MVIFLALILALPTLASTEPEGTLLFRDLDVVEGRRASPGGPWSFSELTRRATRGKPDWPQAFLGEWQAQTASNGQPLVPRRSFDLLDYWKRDREPFRLLAIVFRLDLRSNELPAGEGRFVFGLNSEVGDTGADLTLILEYPLPTSADRSLETWARDLSRLSGLQGEARLEGLERLTQIFSGAPETLNLRTNDFFFSLEWELRNFRLRQGLFEAALLPKTPADSYLQNSADLIAWIRQNAEAVLSGNYELPNEMLAGASVVPDDQFAWLKDADLPEPVRRAFSLRTCNGCHAGETETRFQHVMNRRPGEVAKVSDFMVRDLALRARDLDRILGIGLNRRGDREAAVRPLTVHPTRPLEDRLGRIH